jgi:fatty-acyl-CoA synthase
VSRFTETMFANAHWSLRGMVTSEPEALVRRTWIEVHKRALQVAGGLAKARVAYGDAVAVLAGAPAEIAPTAQGIWMPAASVPRRPLRSSLPIGDLVCTVSGDR